MGNCAYCNSFILFGGKRDHTGTYCAASCQHAGNLLALAGELPAQEVAQRAKELHASKCPRCGGQGPLDMHKAHEVWSALVLTTWSSKPRLTCKSCATKRQLGAIAFCSLAGWWGIPYGLILTPVQIVRNVAGMVGGPKPGQPSALLEKYARLQLGAQITQESTRPASKPPPLPRPAPLTPPENDDRYKPKPAPNAR